MKLWVIITKGLREQFRSFWILLLTLSMGPFFVGIYYLILESSSPRYDILIVTGNQDTTHTSPKSLSSATFLEFAQESLRDTLPIPVTIKAVEDRDKAILLLKQGKADAAVVLGEVDFSMSFFLQPSASKPLEIEFIGDVTSPYYLVSAVWIQTLLSQYLFSVTGFESPIDYSETSLGAAGSVSDFEIAVPGLMILSIIMLMFTASIAFVVEVENRTLIRLRLSKLSPITFLVGIAVVQTIIGIIGLALTLGSALLLGYSITTPIGNILLIASLTSLSIIAFSLLLAAFTKSANEILVVGNFPLFLFMFFTGAAFPINNAEIFKVAGYTFGIQGLMSPTHAISALKKLLIMEMRIEDVIPEISLLILLTILYLALGIYFFWRRHMRMKTSA